jgi:hypothetical protein
MLEAPQPHQKILALLRTPVSLNFSQRWPGRIYKANIGLRGLNISFGGKAGILRT